MRYASVKAHCGAWTVSLTFAELAERWTFDAICLSVATNPPGFTVYMDEVDAARAAQDARARMLIPQHFDLCQGYTLDPKRIKLRLSGTILEHASCPHAFESA